ncbi:hypothetical protein BN59_03537 [Legionella massiliensis]|uniref:Cofactor-independent phosphoglycerate mutase n=1 Tax=Legionella massiliensis TaxID=1034943 RepID=A0A078L563_9GAMM|nr:hypothetical protein [Legionella massiliensis]CDZ79219.1 hypothetical protein BN59_03537 [Legionella massiliensis]CEE14957.1 hypothetical protein BN1094_03537 [Legionella massiliensis]
MDVVVNGIKDELPSDSKPLAGLGDYYQNILLCFSYEPESLPLADLLKHYHQLSGKWLVASPVHWEATHNDAMLVAAGTELELSEDESRLWFTQVADFLKADGFNPVFHDTQTWLFNIDDKPEIKSQSAQSLMHKSLMPALSGLDKSLYWQRLITELQMYLGAHPLSSLREGLAINGLWFWGEGELQIKTKRVVTTDDEVLIDSLGQSLSALSPTTAFAKDDLLIISDPKQLVANQLEERINKHKVNWYWNNCSYSRKATHWWSRLWR